LKAAISVQSTFVQRLGQGAAMDLKKCKSCKNMVGAESFMCPICGYENVPHPVRWFSIGLITLAFAALMTFHFLHH
jgi:hypothetical protein